MSVTVRELPRDASAEDVDAAIRACSDAFKDNHLTLCAIGGQKSLLVPMNRAMIGAGIVGGRVYVAELPVGDDGDGVRGSEKKEVVGAAVWFPPGNAFLASEGQADAGFNEFMTKLGELDPDVSKWWSTFLPEYDTFCVSSFGSSSYKLSGWHLQWFGVHSSFQRRGIGRTLIEHVKTIIRQNPNTEGNYMCLETDSERGRKFYKAVGFEEKGTQTFRAEAKLNTDVQMWCFAQEV